MKKPIDFNIVNNDPVTNQKLIEKSFEDSKLDKQLGFVGKFFGYGDGGKLNIAGFCIALLLLLGISYTFIALNCSQNHPMGISVLQLWGIISPIITLALGYTFGKNSK